MRNVRIYDNMFLDYCIEIIYEGNSLKDEIINKINECQNEIKITIYSENKKNLKFINLLSNENIKNVCK